ncbi:hypothetical protein CC85DRAFT_284686 [Cutaneotrichosporon oleaginosum]|uniref:Uncharacterized protein n=1 Tax=Cutaneotrichosporon oleaginosum TaxID=879819 RepID=A0A0J0XQE2_9TREE|nr:uncharacterized protein CC85DRAFT_284686 [Cutaneotrichosporon oleaginosum]KLT43335.1 hypothetical protein CC85DRAFT_284686 [Cutaneotrichosporon oleaginosum]TXT14403.1 hypothetical protein COLE_00596 [Cutaneotrichosporon oleaginosum]
MFALRLGRLRSATALRGQALLSSRPLPSPLSRSLHATPVAAKKVIKRSSLTPTQRKALAKQRELAKAIAQDDGSVLQRMQPNAPPVTNTELTLGDLERFKPSRMPAPLTGSETPNPRYATRYAELERNLSYAFRRDQVVKLAAFVGVRVRAGETKFDLVRRVMAAAWDFKEPLAPVETSTFERSILLSKAQMFVLQRSKAVEAYLGTLRGVRFGVDSDETGMFIIRAEGGKTAVTALETYLLETAKAAVSVEWPASAMGFQPSAGGMWAVSTATGALIEAVGWTSYRATAGTLGAAEAARDVMLRAGARFKAASFAPSLRALLPPHDPSSETRFCLMPHKPARLAPLLWSTELAIAERPLFRLSRVEGRAESAGARDLRHRSVEIADARVIPLGKGEAGTLASVVDETLAKAALPEAARTLSFRFGHVLTPGTSALSPPVEGAWALEAPASPWLKLSNTVFGPSIPPALIRFPPAGAPQRFRRVTYAADGMRYVATYAYAMPAEPEVAESARDSRPWIVALDKQLALAREQALARERGDDVPFDFDAIKSLIEEEAKPEPAPLVVGATMGRETARDIIFPDRPVDARIIAASTHESSVPGELQSFFERVHANADAQIDLADTPGLRRGVASAKPAPRAEKADEEVYEGYEEWEQDGEYEDEFERPPEPVREAPAPVDDAPDILPPRTVTVAGHEFALEADEVLEVVESSVALAAHESGQEGMQRAALRTVAAADLTGPGGVLRYGEVYAELPEAETPVDPSIWRELANATREIAPSVSGTQFASI